MHPGRSLRRRWFAAGLLAMLATLGAIARAWWRVDPWPPQLVLDRPGSSWSYDPDGRSYLTRDATSVTAWDLETGRPSPTRPIPGRDAGPVFGRVISADRRRFVGWDGGNGAGIVVAAGDAETGAIERRLATELPNGLDLGFRPDGRTVEIMLPISGNRMTVSTWDTGTGAESRRTVLGPGAGFTRPVAYAPDGRTWAYFATVGGGIQLWDSVADRPIGGLLRSPTTGRPEYGGNQSPAAVFTPDGRTLIAGRSDGQLEFWDVAAGRFLKVVRVHPDGYHAWSLHLAPAGRVLVSLGQSGLSPFLGIWNEVGRRVTGRSPVPLPEEIAALDLATDRVVARTDRGRFLDFSPDGRTVLTEQPDGSIAFRKIPGR